MVGHLNTILAPGGKCERSNLQKFKCTGFARKGGRGMLKFRVDRRIISFILHMAFSATLHCHWRVQ